MGLLFPDRYIVCSISHKTQTTHPPALDLWLERYCYDDE